MPSPVISAGGAKRRSGEISIAALCNQWHRDSSTAGLRPSARNDKGVSFLENKKGWPSAIPSKYAVVFNRLPPRYPVPVEASFPAPRFRAQASCVP